MLKTKGLRAHMRIVRCPLTLEGAREAGYWTVMVMALEVDAE